MTISTDLTMSACQTFQPVWKFGYQYFCTKPQSMMGIYVVALFLPSQWWSRGGCLGGRCTGELYPGLWAGVAVGCCDSCSGYLRRQGYAGFFLVSACGLGMEGFGKNPSSSVVIGVLTGLWAAGSWCLSIYMLPLTLRFYIVLL